MLDWFSDLFTAANIGYFMLGVGAAALWHWVKAQLSNRVLVFRWQFVALPIACFIAINVSLQSQQNADCVREFQQVLRDRSALTSENDKLSQQQRLLIYNWMHSLVFPPPDIARLPGNDPVREKWAIDLTVDTDRKYRASLDEQRENDEYRAAHPLPPAPCGL